MPTHLSEAAMTPVEAVAKETADVDPRAELFAKAGNRPCRRPHSRQVTRHPVFISVAAELAGCTPRPCGSTTSSACSLVTPSRTRGGGRRYSARDVASCARCNGSPRTGHQPPGIARILQLGTGSPLSRSVSPN